VRRSKWTPFYKYEWSEEIMQVNLKSLLSMSSTAWSLSRLQALPIFGFDEMAQRRRLSKY
jgi:hypothetical protein